MDSRTGCFHYRRAIDIVTIKFNAHLRDGTPQAILGEIISAVNSATFWQLSRDSRRGKHGRSRGAAIATGANQAAPLRPRLSPAS